MSERPLAAVTIDLDGVAAHLQGYGIDVEPPPWDAVYGRALPRLLDLLSELGLRATFFAVGREAARHPSEMRALVEAGHELASHTLTHPQPFSTLDDGRLARELRESRACLEDLVGRPVEGFRAPGWDVDERVLEATVRAGYRYDSSLFPSPAILAVRLLTFARGRGRRLPLGLGLHLRTPPRPHLLRRPGWHIAEAPMAVLPIVRIPFYHTGAYFLPRPAMDALETLYRASGEPLTYQLHGVDLLALEDRGVDRRLACHPGMRLPLARKRGLLRRRLLRIARAWRCRTLGELVDEACGGLRLPVRPADPLRTARPTGAGGGDSRNGSRRGQALRGGRL